MGGTASTDRYVYKAPTEDELVQYDGKEQYWYTESNAEAKINVAKTGVASNAPMTIMQQFQKAVQNSGEVEAFRWEEGDDNWKSMTWSQYYQRTKTAGRAFIKLGVEAFDSVNVIGFNSKEWIIGNLGAIACGGKAAGIYSTNKPEACKYISAHSGAVVVLVENDMQLQKFLQIRDELPKLKAIVQYKGKVTAENANVDGKARVMDWEEFMALGEAEDKETLEEELTKRINAQKPGHCSTLIYTSGTTGNPKAVMISHDNATWTAATFLQIMPNAGEGIAEHVVSFLPLSHIAAQMLDIHAPMALAASSIPVTVHFARPTALKGTLGLTLKAARPTLFFGVPRVWEKIADKMKAIGAQTTGLKKVIATWAKAKGAERFQASMVKGGDGSAPAFFGLADSLVLSKIKLALGLDRCRLCMTGAAPIPRDVMTYFGGIGIPIHEIYGMSENSGPQTACRYNYIQVGSTGTSIPGVEIRIDHDAKRDKEGEGEICFRGRHVMMGYLGQPEKTQEAIDPEGWLHSGDVGRVDEFGLLYITGRIKELLVTAGGENIAPVPHEDNVKSVLPGISNIMMIGDKRKFCSALVTLRLEPTEDGGFSDVLTGESAKVDPECKTIDQAIKSEKWQKYIQDGIDKANEEAVSNAAKIRKFVILATDFSVPGGELTATLKLRRKVCDEKYSEQIESIYADL